MSLYLRFSLLILLCAGLTLGLVGCGSDSTNKVAFLTQTADGNSAQINIMKNDGTQVTPVGQPGEYYSAALSNNGSHIAVNYWDDNGGEIAVMKVDGTGLKVLNTTDNTDNYEPVFWPGDKKVLYRSYRPDYADLILVKTDGTGEVNLTNTQNLCFHSPAVSPDGKKIVAEAHGDVDGTYVDTLFILNADGSNLKMLTQGDDYLPSFSPDGKHIVFTRYDDTGDNIYIMKVDGTDIKALTTTGADWDPIFVGNKILFVSDRDDPSSTESALKNKASARSKRDEMDRIHAKDRHAARTNEATSQSYVEIYSMDPDGTHQTRLTNNTVADVFIAED